MDPERRRGLQDARVRELTRKVFESPSPLFRRKFEAAGISDPRDVNGVGDLSRVPVVVKQDLRDSEADTPPWGDYRFTDPRAAVRIGTSTGTTGQPTISIWTRRDLWIEYESAARNWWRAGYRPGMIATHAHPAYLYAGGTMLTGAYEYFGLLTIWVPPPETDELAEVGLRFWTRVRPDIPFMGFSTGRFLEAARRLGIDPAEAGIVPRPMPGFGMGKGLPLMTAGVECYAYLASGCGMAPGGHVAEDWAVVQAVDPETGREVADGEWGNLVVTTLDRDNGLVRYDLEEACAILRDPCPCGETTIRGLWGGRFKDLLSVQGKRFQVSELESAIASVAGMADPSVEFQVVRPDVPDAPLRVRVEGPEAGPGPGELSSRVQAAVEARLGVKSEVDLLERGTLPRSGYKATRVVES